MSFVVCLHISFLRKSFVASWIFTSVWFLSRMYQHVSLQSVFSAETGSANFAGKWPELQKNCLPDITVSLNMVG